MAANGHAVRHDVSDTESVRELLGMIKMSLATIGQTYRTLNEQSEKVSALGPTMKDASTQIQELRRQIKAQEKKEDMRVDEVKKMIKNSLKEKVAKEMQDQIRNQIKGEIAAQVKEQMGDKIDEVLPMSLGQAEQCKGVTIDVRNALANSEARRANSLLRSDNLDDRLAVVLNPDGKKSDVYPADLRSLFHYDDHTIRVLLRDLGLSQLDSREENMSRFMAYIGLPFQLVSVPVVGEKTIPSPVELLRAT